MKIKEGFVLRTICGQNVISGEGTRNVNFSKLVSLNETAAFLFQKVQGIEFDAGTIAELILSEYEGVDRERALADAKNLCAQWVEVGIAQ
ncbi:MAG: PqqD family protein [Bacteroidales bacterium]|nr:PqqD family protein [Bacteroidales bacterium]